MQVIIPCFYYSSHPLHDLFTRLVNNFGTKQIRIPSALTDRILGFPSCNISPPVVLCLSSGILDIPFKPIKLSLQEVISPIPNQSNGFLILLHPYRHFFTRVKFGRTIGEEKRCNNIDTALQWESKRGSTTHPRHFSVVSDLGWPIL